MQADSPIRADTPSASRKNSKPIMEKRRRARINTSLTELKSLLLDVIKKEGSRQNKMEKADILEMTVRHLRQIQRNQFTAAVCADAEVMTKYQNGFRECADEVKRYLSNVDGLDAEIRVRLLNHLANSMAAINQTVTNVPSPETVTAHVRPLQNRTGQNEHDVNVTMAQKDDQRNEDVLKHANFLTNETISSKTKLPCRVDLIPQKISPGDVAVIIPNNILASHLPGYVIPIYAGAQTNSAQIGFSQIPLRMTTGSTLIQPIANSSVTSNTSTIYGMTSHRLGAPHSSFVPSLSMSLQQQHMSVDNNVAHDQRATGEKRDDNPEQKIEIENHNVRRDDGQGDETGDMWRPW